MSEVSGPIVAITLVLSSVFVPLAFLGGVTGEFYRQFAVTIAAAVIISGFNSLTLSPALAAMLLQPHGAKKDALGRLIERAVGRPFGAFNRMFRRFGDRYSGGIGATIGRAPRLLAIYGVLIVVTVVGFRAVAGGYIPTQDKQYLFAILQLPEAATIDRTDVVLRRMGQIALDTPGVADVVQFPGLNAVHFVATPNAGVMFIGLEPKSRRKVEAAEIAASINGQYAQIQEGLAFALLPPPVLGLGNANGIELYVQDRGGLGYGELYQTRAHRRRHQGLRPMALHFVPVERAAAGRHGRPHQGQGTRPVADRRIRDAAGLPGIRVRQRLQHFRPHLFGLRAGRCALSRDRTRYRGAEGAQRRRRDGPLGSVVDIQPSYGPDPVIRYNSYPAADMSAGINPAVLSSNEALVKAQQVAEQVLPRGMAVEWTGLTYQQVTQGNAALFVFPLCVLLVYMVLAALYESLSLPLAIILIVPLCLLSAIGGIWLVNFIHGLWVAISAPPFPPEFLDNNIFTKIGLAVLIGLACKNAILIVEFARDLEEEGKGIVEAAIEACRLRLRPILMTSFAFIAGGLPLAFATGAGTEVRHVMGVTVVSGMLGVSFFGLFFTPVFYVVLRKMVVRQHERRVARRAAAGLHQ
jgi:multidrug efflux pump